MEAGRKSHKGHCSCFHCHMVVLLNLVLHSRWGLGREVGAGQGSSRAPGPALRIACPPKSSVFEPQSCSF